MRVFNILKQFAIGYYILLLKTTLFMYQGIKN